MSEYFSGRVHTVVFENPKSAFYILKVVLDNPSGIEEFNFDKTFSNTSSDVVAVRGTIPGVAPRVGFWFGFEADWDNHPKYGRQLAITRAPILKKEWDEESAENALNAHGVGDRVLGQIRQVYKDGEFLAALGDTTKLEAVPGITPFVAQHVVQRWQAVQTYFKVVGFLVDLGLPPGKVNQVWSKFGDEVEAILTTDPWALLQVEGFQFKQADEIAFRLGLPELSPGRYRGAIISACRDLGQTGHLYNTTGQLFAEVSNLIPGITTDDFAKALAECHKNQDVKIDRQSCPGLTAVYDTWAWTLEKTSAELLLKRVKAAAIDREDYLKCLCNVGPDTERAAKTKRVPLAKVVKTAIEEWGASTHLNLSDAQKTGVCNALLAPVSILTGLPGTGKTLSLQAVVSILKDMGIPHLLCAPTGIAAKNLGLKTGAQAHTIHRAFSAKGDYDSGREATYMGVVGDHSSAGLERSVEQTEEWGYDQDNPYPTKVMLVDESSMLDQHLLYRVLVCTPEDCRLVFIGDAAQLPSVGPGNVLRDLIGSGIFPTVNLTEIFRQKDTSGIVYAAHAIHHGEMPNTETADFRLLSLRGEDKVADAICQLAVKLHAGGSDFQIISPRHAGVVGVTNLNTRLRELLNPSGQGQQEITVADSTIRESDRVMVVHNDYKLGVYNGDIGQVARIDRKAKTVEVRIVGEPIQLVAIPFKDVGRLLRLAYASTVHKVQGLEFDTVLTPLVESFRHQLQRNLLYTAVTRAKKRVVLVGSAVALELAVMNDREDQRNSLFKYRLQSGSAKKKA